MKLVKDSIRKLSEFAYISLLENRIIFKKMRFVRDKTSLVEDTGVFERHEGGENGDIYQFKHLVFQEFLCAIYIANNFLEIEKFIGANQFSNSILMVLGLIGLLLNKSLTTSYLKEFVKAVIDFKEEDLTKYDECITATLNSIKKMITNNIIERRETTNYFLSAVHEYNSDLPDDSKKLLSSNDASFEISYHHELINLVYFLKHMQVDSIDSITIAMMR